MNNATKTLPILTLYIGLHAAHVPCSLLFPLIWHGLPDMQTTAPSSIYVRQPVCLMFITCVIMDTIKRLACLLDLVPRIAIAEPLFLWLFFWYMFFTVCLTIACFCLCNNVFSWASAWNTIKQCFKFTFIIWAIPYLYQIQDGLALTMYNRLERIKEYFKKQAENK